PPRQFPRSAEQTCRGGSSDPPAQGGLKTALDTYAVAQVKLVSDPSAEFNRALNELDADLKRLETEYNMYFSGRLRRPPWETRSRVETTVKRLDRTSTSINNYGVRFRFTTLQT